MIRLTYLCLELDLTLIVHEPESCYIFQKGFSMELDEILNIAEADWSIVSIV